MNRALSAMLLVALVVVLALPAYAATFSCVMRSGSCNGGETLLIRLNSSEAGNTPNNSHAQLANYSGTAYPYSVCCSTDAFRTLTNTCGSNSTTILKLSNDTDAHVQAGTQSGYAYNACLNVTSGNITCEYPAGACGESYAGILSIASSDAADNNLTNAHVGEFALYNRKVCCMVGAQNPPVVSNSSLAPSPTATTRQDLDCQNGAVTDADGDSVTLHYNWYRNGTSATLVNLPLDYDGASTTYDISGRAKHGVLAGGYAFVPTGGRVGGGFTFDGSTANITVSDTYSPTAYTIAAWVKLNNVSRQTIILRTSAAGPQTSWSHMLRVSATGRFEHYTFDGTTKTVSGSTTPNAGTWYHVVGTANNSGVMRLYVNGQEEGTAVSITTLWASGDRYLIGPPADAGGASKALNGTIDEVLIFNRSLTADEVRTLYNGNNRYLNSTETRRGEEWNCSITPVDSTGLNGTTRYSNKTTITGSAPLAPNLTYPANNNQSVFERHVNFTWTQADERDSDQVNYTLNLTVTPGSCSVQTAQTNIQNRYYRFGELCTDQLYNWTITACDVDGCSSASTKYNFTIASVIGVRLIINSTNFGTFERGESRATDVNTSISPLVVNNTGNVRANITLVGNNSPFTTVALPTTSFQFKAGVNTTNAFNQTGSQMTYTTVDTAYKNLIKQLNYSDAATGANTTARIDINITPPMDEPPGFKRAVMTVRGVAG